mmetsp:Transcript_15781/g.7583  ORF Transcript_15781/g.7583 Transcript_15781/m.7583 type:complete len:83 (+) Transcript_15781:79-327(+)
MIHRDVKTDNILLDENNEAVLADLGLLVYYMEYTLDERKRVVGTPNYMGPECWDDKVAVTNKADVWAFACVINEIFTDQRPW